MAILVAGAFLATFVAQLATLPILLPISGGFSLVSLPANLAIGPLVALAFPLAAVAGLLGVVWLPLAAAVAVPTRLACEAILGIVEWSAAQGASVHFGDLPSRALLVVSLLATATCLAASRDAWRTWQRWPHIWSRMGERERWLWGGAAAGFGLAFVAGLGG
ncbi:MAG TPA: ComEC/Rec2 family competence protein [Thermomicrobiales bacterium]|nr:ComEC/Rec2 family competence protein [Thermomicrobiales bacterium]